MLIKLKNIFYKLMSDLAISSYLPSNLFLGENSLIIFSKDGWSEEINKQIMLCILSFLNFFSMIRAYNARNIK